MEATGSEVKSRAHSCGGKIGKPNLLYLLWHYKRKDLEAMRSILLFLKM